MVYADSSAALAIAKRKGAGKLRHINVSSIWIQERQDKKDLECRKVLGAEDPADMMTNHLLRELLDKCMGHLSQRRMSGRAKSGLEIQGKNKRGGEQKENGSRIAIGQVEEDGGTSVESEVTDPEMPALEPLVMPATRSAFAALARLNAKLRRRGGRGRSPGKTR